MGELILLSSSKLFWTGYIFVVQLLRNLLFLGLKEECLKKVAIGGEGLIRDRACLEAGISNFVSGGLSWAGTRSLQLLTL